ncbi:MAG TPA: cache domain-containing protein [Alphaproteobacteria bacterium]|nr:cache domain-containing protein [Alphaproteobacteria bacterium]
MRLFAFATVLAAGLAFGAQAQTAKPTVDDAKRITLQATDLIQAKGLEGAAPSFNADGEYKFGEIYVNVIDFEGKWLVYPPRPAGVGQSVLNVKDADGKFLVQEIIKVAKDQGEGWVEYRWMNPAVNKIQPKVTYVKRVPGKDLIAYVGIYKD